MAEMKAFPGVGKSDDGGSPGFPADDPSRESKAGSLFDRLRQCAKMAGSGDRLAQKAAIPRRTLETYLAGRVEPKASRLVAIARAVGVSLDWLLVGAGPMRPVTATDQSVGTTEFGLREGNSSQLKPFVNHDEDLLTAVVVAVEELLAEEGLSPRPQKKGQLIAALYELSLADGTRTGAVDRRMVAPLLRLVK